MASTSSSTPQEKYDLITRNLQEVLGGEAIKAKLDAGETVKCYWGTATTGRPHIGYFVPLTKLADFLKAGVAVKVLLAGIHAFLDAGKSTLELVAHRVQYYSKVLHAVLAGLGVPTDKLEFVTGSDYQLSRGYSLDVFRLTAICSERDAKKAGAEVVKQNETVQLSSLLYPGLQALDEEYLDVDFQFGGVDQRKIFTFAELYLPRLGYRKRSHLMNAMVPGLVAGGKMSSSDPNSKIDFLDSPADVKKKISKAFCEPGNIEENGLLSFLKAVAIPVSEMRRAQVAERGGDPDAAAEREATFVRADAPKGTLFSIERDEKFGGPIHYSSYAAMEEEFAKGELHPGDLKRGVTDAINQLLAPVRKAFDEDEAFQAIEKEAYPKPAAPEKGKKGKEKQPKKDGAATHAGADGRADELAAKSKAAATEKAEVNAEAIKVGGLPVKLNDC